MEEQLQTTNEELETVQKKSHQEVDQMSTQLNDLTQRNFEEEAALRRVCLLHLLFKMLYHISIQLKLDFPSSIVRKSSWLMQLLLIRLKILMKQ